MSNRRWDAEEEYERLTFQGRNWVYSGAFEAQDPTFSRICRVSRSILWKLYAERPRSEIVLERESADVWGLDTITDIESSDDKAWAASEPEARVVRSIRGRVRRFLCGKDASFQSVVGATPAKLSQYIESQFEYGMTWENHGEWHIDHVIPIAAYDLSSEDEIHKASNWRNLRPMWASENMSKGASIDHDLIKSMGIGHLLPEGLTAVV